MLTGAFIILVVTATLLKVEGIGINLQELTILEEFYHATSGESWVWQSPFSDYGQSWDFSKTKNSCDNWQGIICSDNCDSSRCTILQIDLREFGLQGVLPTSLSNLTDMAYLLLSDNNLYGSFPSSILNSNYLQQVVIFNNQFTGKLPSLTITDSILNYLDLNSNMFTGSIPESYGDLTKLTYFDVSSNLLNGSIPSSLTSASALTYLYLYYNFFSGSLPTGLFSMPSLAYFSAGGNALTCSLPEFSAETPLIFLSLFDNQLTGSLPVSIASLAELTYVYLYQNSLRGALPTGLFAMSSLTVFSAGTNAFTGSLPEFSAATPLTDLYLYDNQLNGSIPDSMATARRLANLALYYNLLQGSIPSALFQNRRLVYVDLRLNYLSGSIPEFAASSQLSSLFLSDNRLQGSLPESIASLSSLVSLYLGGNYFLNGTLSEGLLSLPALQTVYLSYNAFSGSLPSAGYGDSIIFLNLEYNVLTGTIPAAVMNLPTLFTIWLEGNDLSGTLPSLPSTSWLNTIEVGWNFLSGTIPASYLSSATMATLDLSGNSLSGTIPGKFGATLSYVYLSLSGLTGTLPVGIANSSVKLFSASNNNLEGPFVALPPTIQLVSYNLNALSGTLPSLTGYPNLLYFDVGYNQLSGPLAAFLPDTLRTVTLSNNHFTGSLPQSLLQQRDMYRLIVNNNDLSGDLSMLNPSLAAIQAIDVSENRFEGPLPTAVFSSPFLQSFVAVKNCFTGSLPSQICNAPFVTTLVLSGLHASSSCTKRFFPTTDTETYYLQTSVSSIPPCIYEMPWLQVLHLAGNNLEGSLPDELPPMLKDLSLSHNTLTGDIPASFFAQNWSSLDLSHNKLTGFIDGAFQVFQVTDYVEMSLRNNRLSGTISASLLDVEDISILDGNMFPCDDQDRAASLPSHDEAFDKYQCGSNAVESSSYSWLTAICLLVGSFVALVLLSAKAKETAATWYSALQQASQPNTCKWRDFNLLLKWRVAPIASAVVVAFMVIYGSLSVHYSTYQEKYAWVISIAYLSGLAPGIVIFIPCFAAAILFAAVALMSRAAVVDRNGAGEPAPSDAQPKNRLRTAAVFLLNFAVMAAFNAGFVYVVLNEDQARVNMAAVGLSLFKVGYSKLIGALTKHERDVNARVFQQFLIELVNEMVIPVLATAAISTNCFYNVLASPDVITTLYFGQVCVSYNLITLECNENYLITYVPFQPPFVYSYQCSSALVVTYASVYIYSFLILLLGQLMQAAVMRAVVWFVGGESWAGKWALHRLPYALRRTQIAADEHTVVLNKEKYFKGLFTHWLVLPTFGVAYPPLGIMICISMVLYVLWHEMLVGGALQIGKSHNAHKPVADAEEPAALPHEANLSDVNVSAVEDILEKETANATHVAGRVLRIIACFSALFYSLFIFDIIGDKEGWRAALPAMLVMMAGPPLVLLCDKAWERSSARNSNGKLHAPPDEGDFIAVCVDEVPATAAVEMTSLTKGYALVEGVEETCAPSEPFSATGGNAGSSLYFADSRIVHVADAGAAALDSNAAAPDSSGGVAEEAITTAPPPSNTEAPPDDTVTEEQLPQASPAMAEEQDAP